MQTVKTEVSNQYRGNSKPARLLIDSGSQRTYITEDLADYRSQLKSHITKKISLITFGAERPKIVKTLKVSLKLKPKDGHHLRVDANVVITITGTVQMKPVLKDIQDRCQNLRRKVQLADTLHVKLENSTIDILISNDDYLNLILPERREIQKVV